MSSVFVQWCSRVLCVGLLFCFGADAQSSLVGTTNLEFNFAARQAGTRPGFATSLGGVAMLEPYLMFLQSTDIERDFAPTNVTPASLVSDALLEVNISTGQLWFLSTTVIGRLPLGARLEVEVQGTRRSNVTPQLQTIVWWDRGSSTPIRLNFRLFLNRDVQPGNYSFVVQYTVNQLP